MLYKELFRKKSIESILAHADKHSGDKLSMRRNLRLRDLIALGIAAIVGAGIFSTIGNAAVNGGPAVSLLFVFTALACGFSALCYAQFASAIPLSGSAYTYAYASFGELIAWIIGWVLIMEYGVGNIAVAISWSDYFTGLLSGLGINIPAFLSVDYLTASRGFQEARLLLAGGLHSNELTAALQEAYFAWMNAPMIGSVRFIADIPAFGIVVLITSLVFVGIRTSKVASNIMVILKLIILVVIIGVGAFYVEPENWSPFAPNGLGGVLKGVGGVFFAYIGFDAISTTAEECKNPRRDLPRAMIISLLIVTVLYICISLVLTGMLKYSYLGVGDPLAFVFSQIGLTRLSGIIAIGAVIAMAGVLLVFQVGQPRIWMSMSRDGLLPPVFSKLHPKFKTPAFATVVAGIFVAVPCLFMNITEVTDLTAIGTLFVFSLVCGGVLLMDVKVVEKTKSYRIPYINSRYFLPPLLLLIVFSILHWNHVAVSDFFSFKGHDKAVMHLLLDKIPVIFFILFSCFMIIIAVIKQLTLIPVIGLITNLYLMTELGITNWIRLIIWMAAGLILYFLYGYRKSKMRYP